MSPNSRVLAIARHHARKKVHNMPGIEIERLELMDQVAHIRGFALHQLLNFQQFSFALF